MKHLKIIFLLGALLLGVVAFVVIRWLNAKAQIGVGYMTKIICSEHFVAGRFIDNIRAQDFFGLDPLVDKISIKVDKSKGTVSGHVFGLGRSVAKYRSGVGCSPVAQKGVEPVTTPEPNPVPHSVEENIRPDIQALVEAAIADQGPNAANQTRALLVLQDGKIIGEAYAKGFEKDTKMQSWSMAKSVTAMLVGILADERQLNIYAGNLLPEWADDPRAEISLHHLLRMESGLAAHEVYDDPTSDVVQMLFRNQDTGTFAMSKPLESKPGKVFEYSSATTNLMSHLIRQFIRNDENYHAYPRQALFDPLGMSSAIFEVDASGHFIGSSFIYATARDYARLGQLYLNEGRWRDVQIVSEDWVEYTTTPTKASGGTYAGHIWVNGGSQKFPDLPESTYYFAGHDSQYVIVIPDKNVIIVRLGITRPPADSTRDLYPWFAKIYEAL